MVEDYILNMAKCTYCGDEVSMPFNCNGCGQDYCSNHRLPEKHNCEGLRQPIDIDENRSSQYGDIKQSIDSMIDRVLNRLIYRSVTVSLALLISATYLLQLVIVLVFGTGVHDAIFVLRSDNIEYIWTWISSIFAHSYSSFIHIIGNLIILLFFGSLLEKIIGQKRFFALFIISGVIAGLSQIIVSLSFGSGIIGVIGASGALLSVMGVLTVYNPRMKVYLYFLIPIPIWIISAGYASISILGFVLAGGGVFGSVAHIAHLTGLAIGIAYGLKTKNRFGQKTKSYKLKNHI